MKTGQFTSQVLLPSLLLLGVMLGGCERIPLTPPGDGMPAFSFEIAWNALNLQANESTGSWTHHTDTVQGSIDHEVAYTHAASGEIWALVHHVPLEVVGTLDIGIEPHRPAVQDQWTGTVTVPETWLDAGEWHVQDNDVSSAQTAWSVDENGVLEIDVEMEWTYDNESVQQDLELELMGLGGCEGFLLPSAPMVEMDANGWSITPPVADEGLLWQWTIDGEEYMTEGGAALSFSWDDDDHFAFDVTLEQGSEDHPYGVFSLHRQLDWDGNWDDALAQTISQNILLERESSAAHSWMELKHQNASGTWFHSVLACEESDQLDWRFEVLNIEGIQDGQAFAGFESMAFTCVMPLRPVDDFATAPATVTLTGTWPIQP